MSADDLAARVLDLVDNPTQYHPPPAYALGRQRGGPGAADLAAIGRAAIEASTAMDQAMARVTEAVDAPPVVVDDLGAQVAALGAPTPEEPA